MKIYKITEAKNPDNVSWWYAKGQESLWPMTEGYHVGESLIIKELAPKEQITLWMGNGDMEYSMTKSVSEWLLYNLRNEEGLLGSSV